jgi:hypothetical protein
VQIGVIEELPFFGFEPADGAGALDETSLHFPFANWAFHNSSPFKNYFVGSTAINKTVNNTLKIILLLLIKLFPKNG